MAEKDYLDSSEQESVQSPLTLIRQALHEENLAAVPEIINEESPASIARILESLPPSERTQVWACVRDEYNADVLAHLSESVLEEIVDDMSHDELKQSADDMDEDDLVDFLQDLPEDRAFQLIESFDEKRRERLAQILEYDENSAGGMMNTDAIAVRLDTTVATVIRYIRRRELPAVTNKIFIVDDEDIFQGEVILTHLLTADNNQQMQEIMNQEAPTLKVDTPSAQVARLFREKDLISAAVLDDNQHLLGRITIDDVVDYIQEESERLLMQTAGMDEEVDTFAPIHKAVASRGIWLCVNLITALLAASVINAFSDTIEKVVALAALSPVVASMGGNTGMQALTVIIRGIALGQIEGANARALIMRELCIAAINGALWGLVIAIIAFFWFGQSLLSLIVFTAILVNLLFAGFSGVLIPLILTKLRIDPALAGSIMLTMITDIVGFFVLLGLAYLFLV